MGSKVKSRRPGQVARSVCRQCDRRGTEANPLSSRLLCRECAAENIMEPALQLQARCGPAYDEWVKRSREYFERIAAG